MTATGEYSDHWIEALVTPAEYRIAGFGGAGDMQGTGGRMIESREVMNLRQASQYLGVSPDTLYRYICDGVVPAFKLGSRWKFRKTVLDRWMERKMRQPRGTRRG
jgi:excisionase family DNA binding protein